MSDVVAAARAALGDEPRDFIGCRLIVPVLDQDDRHLVHEVIFRRSPGGLEHAETRQTRLPTWQEQVAATYAMMDR